MSKTPDILTTVPEVTAALGGIKAVANLTGRKYSAAGNWGKKIAPQFPANTFVAMNAALAAIGKSAPASLWSMKMGDAA